jgi:hypothetical protein
MDLQFSDKLQRVSTSRVENLPVVLHLLCQLGRFHLGLDDLQSDCTAAEMVVPQQLRAMADSEATLAQLRSRLILQALGVAHQLGRRISMDRRGRHGALDCRKCVTAGVERASSERFPRPARFCTSSLKLCRCTLAQLHEICCVKNEYMKNATDDQCFVEMLVREVWLLVRTCAGKARLPLTSVSRTSELRRQPRIGQTSSNSLPHPL